MVGTKIGGQKAAAANLARDPDFYRKNGRKSQAAWAKNGRKPRGFATMDKEKLSELGRQAVKKRRLRLSKT